MAIFARPFGAPLEGYIAGEQSYLDRVGEIRRQRAMDLEYALSSTEPDRLRRRDELAFQRALAQDRASSDLAVERGLVLGSAEAAFTSGTNTELLNNLWRRYVGGDAQFNPVAPGVDTAMGAGAIAPNSPAAAAAMIPGVGTAGAVSAFGAPAASGAPDMATQLGLGASARPVPRPAQQIAIPAAEQAAPAYTPAGPLPPQFASELPPLPQPTTRTVPVGPRVPEGFVQPTRTVQEGGRLRNLTRGSLSDVAKVEGLRPLTPNDYELILFLPRELQAAVAAEPGRYITDGFNVYEVPAPEPAAEASAYDPWGY